MQTKGLMETIGPFLLLRHKSFDFTAAPSFHVERRTPVCITPRYPYRPLPPAANAQKSAISPQAIGGRKARYSCQDFAYFVLFDTNLQNNV